MDFPWHKPSSYGGTHDLGNLPYMFWFWSIQKGLTNDGFCITFGIHRRPLELTFSWLVGPLVASGIEWLIYGSASCRGASVHPCPLFHQKTHKFPGSCRKLHSKIIQTSPSVGSLLANFVGTTGAVWKLKGTSPTLMGWASVSLWVEWPNIGAFSPSHFIPGASGSSAEAVELAPAEENWHLRCGPSRGGWWLGYVGIFSCHGVIKTYWRNRKYIEKQSMHRPSQSCCSFLCRIMYTSIQLLPAECRSSHSAKSQASSSSKRLEYKYVIRRPPGVKPPTRTGWTVSGTSAEIWANLWASSLEPLFEVSQGHLGQVKSKTRMVCAAFQVSSCVHFRGRFLSRPSRRRRGLRFWSIVRPQQHQKGSPAAGALQWLETSVSFVKIWGNHGKTRTSHGYSMVWKATSSLKWRMESKSTSVFYKETPCRNHIIQ